MKSGRTRPVLLAARRDGIKHDKVFVVKALGLPEVLEHSLAHEFVGGRLAALFGLAAPATEVVNISGEFLAAVAADLSSAGVSMQPGAGIGSEFVPNLTPFAVPVKLADDERPDAARILAFDLLFQNPDRHVENPNCGRAAGRIVPYDFESSFSFRFDILKAKAWKVAQLPFVHRHVFCSSLRGDLALVNEALDAAHSVSPTEVAAACAATLPAWGTIAREITSHFQAVHSHWSEFSSEVAMIVGNPS